MQSLTTKSSNFTNLTTLLSIIQPYSIGTTTKSPRPFQDSPYISALTTAASSRGADGLVFIAEYQDGSIIWGTSDFTFKSFFSANLNHSYFIRSSPLTLPSSLLKNINNLSPKITLILTRNTKTLSNSLNHIPQHPDLTELYLRYLKSPHFRSFSNPTQITFRHFMESILLNPKHTKLSPSDSLNPKTLSTLSLSNFLSTIQAITGIQHIIFKTPRRRDGKSGEVRRPDHFAQTSVTVDIHWNCDFSQISAAS